MRMLGYLNPRSVDAVSCANSLHLFCYRFQPIISIIRSSTCLAVSTDMENISTRHNINYIRSEALVLDYWESSSRGCKTTTQRNISINDRMCRSLTNVRLPSVTEQRSLPQHMGLGNARMASHFYIGVMDVVPSAGTSPSQTPLMSPIWISHPLAPIQPLKQLSDGRKTNMQNFRATNCFFPLSFETLRQINQVGVSSYCC